MRIPGGGNEMALVIICDSCGEKNSASEIFCSKCNHSLAGIKPTRENPAPVEVQDEKNGPLKLPDGSVEQKRTFDSSDTLFEESQNIFLVFSVNGNQISVQPGDVLGREGAGRLEFANFPTVSRKHAKIIAGGGHYAILDLQSKNGTWVNGKKIEGKPHPLKPGDILSLSRSCELMVKEKKEGKRE